MQRLQPRMGGRGERVQSAITWWRRRRPDGPVAGAAQYHAAIVELLRHLSDVVAQAALSAPHTRSTVEEEVEMGNGAWRRGKGDIDATSTEEAVQRCDMSWRRRCGASSEKGR